MTENINAAIICFLNENLGNNKLKSSDVTRFLKSLKPIFVSGKRIEIDALSIEFIDEIRRRERVINPDVIIYSEPILRFSKSMNKIVKYHNNHETIIGYIDIDNGKIYNNNENESIGSIYNFIDMFEDS